MIRGTIAGKLILSNLRFVVCTPPLLVVLASLGYEQNYGLQQLQVVVVQHFPVVSVTAPVDSDVSCQTATSVQCEQCINNSMLCRPCWPWSCFGTYSAAVTERHTLNDHIYPRGHYNLLIEINHHLSPTVPMAIKPWPATCCAACGWASSLSHLHVAQSPAMSHAAAATP